MSARDRDRRWRRNHPDRHAANRDAWKTANPDAVRAANRRYAQRRRGTETGMCPDCCTQIALTVDGSIYPHNDTTGNRCTGTGRIAA